MDFITVLQGDCVNIYPEEPPVCTTTTASHNNHNNNDTLNSLLSADDSSRGGLDSLITPPRNSLSSYPNYNNYNNNSSGNNHHNVPSVFNIASTRPIRASSTTTSATHPPATASTPNNNSNHNTNTNNNNNNNGTIQQYMEKSTQHHAYESTIPIIDPLLEPIIKIKDRLLSLRGSPIGTNIILYEYEIKLLCNMSRSTLLDQSMFLELEAPIKICGDIHGQYSDLLRLFEYGGFPPETTYLFLGDYVDRGKQSIECISLLLCYKILYPDTFYILRGNHESSNINRIYGFYDECKRRYNNIKVWKIYCDIFNCLPVSALIDEKILCMHGGLSPELYDFEQIMNIERPCDIPDIGLLCDLLWSDPSEHHVGWNDNDRGVSYTFGKDIVINFIEEHDLDLIVRAHQVVQDGYEFFAGRRLVTIFSAPNYCGEFDNAGGMISIDEDLLCSFQILKPSTSINNNHKKNIISSSTTPLSPPPSPSTLRDMNDNDNNDSSTTTTTNIYDNVNGNHSPSEINSDAITATTNQISITTTKTS